MSTRESATARQTGRPRSERAERAILEVLGEGIGLAELSIEAIASRAGVGKTTIYRRWSNKEDLVVDALAVLRTPMPPIKGESVRDDLIVMLTAMHGDAVNDRSRNVMHMAMGESDRYPALLAKFRCLVLEPRRDALRAILERGMATGELRADLDTEIALAALNGAVIWHCKWGGGESGAALAPRIVDQLLSGLAPS
jgi:AcrR family transcriptional regulator